jgi:hypothetical protein
MKIIEEPSSAVHVSLMRDGDIATIVSWPHKHYSGRIVQRYRNILITIGEDSGQGLGSLFDSKGDLTNCLVRILPKGTKLEI